MTAARPTAPTGPPAPSSRSGPTVLLLVAWALLSLLLNVRYPALEPVGLYFLPAIDATVLFAVIALFAWRGYRIPGWVVAVLAALVLILRAFRVADGIVWRYFNRPIDLGLDMPTAWAMVHLLQTTVAWPILVISLTLLAGCAFGFTALAAWSVRAAERAFDATRSRALFAGLVTAALLLSPLLPADSGRGMRQGAFAPSLVPRLIEEVGRITRLEEVRQAEAARIRAAADRVRATPGGLQKLGRSNVLLFFIESYGATVIDEPDHRAGMLPVYQQIDSLLAGQGFQVASSLLDSPTYGGRSQLAHQALATGIRAGDIVADDLVQALRPPTMAGFFQKAGYRTVLVMPGNVHRGLYRWLYEFEKVYSSWDLGYRGPLYVLDSMPDQYVVDFIHRQELQRPSAPLFVEYVFVTSHAPWDRQPPFIDDWQMGDGSLFARHAPVVFPVTWSNLREASPAYLRSISYNLRVIVEYLTRFDTGDSLAIVLGDHQPIGDVTRNSPSPAVPIHVISRQGALVEPFRARGYSRNMEPARPQPTPGMDSFLIDFLTAFSR